jgi:hypothetical protein
MVDKKFLKLKRIKDPRVRNQLIKLMEERHRLMKEEKIKKEIELKEQATMHNKYLPKYLSVKILNAIGFIEYTRQKGELDMPAMTNFLKKDKQFNNKEISWVLLLLSLESVEEILSTPEIGNLIRNAILKTKKTIH